MRLTSQEREALFWSYVDRTDPSACWTYPQKASVNGYAVVTVFGRSMLAHRYAYEISVGAIPDGLQLDHLCRNRRCVNPAHLEPVSQRENLLRGEGFAGTNARKTHCKRGHEFTPENTRLRPGGRDCRACARAHDRKRRPRKRKEVVTW